MSITTDTTAWTVSMDTANSNTARLDVAINSGSPSQTWVKGVAYSPCPINGSNAQAPAIGDWFWDTFSPGSGCTITGWNALWQRDLPALRAMGVNVVRVYSMLSRQLDTDGTFPSPWDSGQLFTHTAFLDMCWNGGVAPIYVLVGIPLPQAMFWQDLYNSASSSELDFWNNVLKETAAQVGAHPAVLGILIQNELDSAVVTYPNDDQSNLPSVDFWWSQVQALGQVAKAAAPDKLIGMAVHDDPNIAGRAAPWMEQITSLDFWGVNTYQTQTFQPVFDAVPKIGPGYQGLIGDALKPVILTEFGIPATSHTDPRDPATIFSNAATQAKAAAVLDQMLPQVFGAPPPAPLPAYQSGLSLGVCYFEYCDEWWNQGGSPNIYTWYGGAANPGFPNGYWDQDGFGIYSIARGEGLPNDAPIWYQSGCNGGPATPIDVHAPRPAIVASIAAAFQSIPEARYAVINITVTIDTDAVRAGYQKPSQDPENPTTIDSDMGYMVATAADTRSGQGTETIRVGADVGDLVRVFIASGSDNFEDAVLAYGMPRVAGDPVFDFQPSSGHRERIRSVVVPNSTTSPLPARIADEDFWFYCAWVETPGTAQHLVRFALYTRDDDTGEPVLFGYYAWQPTIRIG